MEDQFSRTRLLIGDDSLSLLKQKRIAVFGIGGVGGYTVEALARSGIGALDLIDNDKISVTNINRQILATLNNIGKFKTEAAKERIAVINPECKVTVYNTFFLPENSDIINFGEYDYIVDAIDTVTGKLCIIENSFKNNTPVISALGAGNKLNAEMFEIADIYDTSVCPLARVIRKECKNRSIPYLKCVYSREKPFKTGNSVPGTISYVPATAGLLLAGEVIKDLIFKYDL